MPSQISIEEYALKKSRHITKKEKFLNTLDGLIDWDELTGIVHPYYYKNRKGRKPVELQTILRMYILGRLYSLSDKNTEQAIYDSFAFRRFMKLDFTREAVPNATTLSRFRRLIGRYKLTRQINEKIDFYITNGGYRLKKVRTVELSLNKTAKKK